MKNKSVKLIAFHLPQYHECEENNMWWGEGFTEWTNTKKALPIFKHHNQPRLPKNDFYYNLEEKDDFIWQLKLAKKYNVYGFCFYHYWFNGKKLLYKPLELLKEIDSKEKIHYCFCWANETWSKTWENDNSVLIEQTYGTENEWEEHFNYLFEFFQDEFYIKHDGSPILIIYRSKMIPNFNRMVEYWNKRCIESGFSGIYIIDEYNSFQNESICEKSIQFEPLYTMKYGRTELEFKYYKFLSRIFNFFYKSNNLIYSYSILWKNILKRNIICNSYMGAFVDWDNTPRKGKNGRIVLGVSTKKFKKYMKKLKNKAIRYNSEYIFINAWNEWGEGTYLEPDMKNGYGYLDVVKDVFGE
ncbi:glycosyltransferase WbsX family protein [Pseudobutyrivibrio sp. MD2005]|uniref:glycosyltransferase WbsX family protein n=1 Tax=Pseudobutyrivibrio sp. MD2005 TaxID=1410616 RepID=UPI0004832BDC|nr:glycoside hydrolase family 99-like domain-containing protein [Pseudobutyrivibrio sp. MD2005]